ncbi:MAG: 16S rRNA (cytidine(1402)-2'-O)-methyltransferase [Hyphomicrobiaceae bacterium]
MPTAPPDRHQAMLDAVSAELGARLAAPITPGLYLVATPIGNLADVTLRALAVLAAVDEIYCEDTRQTQKLLSRFRIDRRLSTYREHNAERERPRILQALAADRSVAVVSDAGTPLISDPGFKLARAAIETGYRVIAIPGASATLTALTVAGLPTDSFHFAGFLPPKSAARRTRIAGLSAIDATLVLFEAPSRLADSLADLAEGLGPRAAAIARELTKLHETIRRGTLPELAAWAADNPPRGEIVLVIGPPAPRELSDDDIRSALEDALAAGTLRDAVSEVATSLGASRSRVYDLAVAMKNRES